MSGGFRLWILLLGERTSTEFHQVRGTGGVKKLRKDAKEAGGVAGRARKDLEKRLGRSIVTKSNFLPRGRNKL